MALNALGDVERFAGPRTPVFQGWVKATSCGRLGHCIDPLFVNPRDQVRRPEEVLAADTDEGYALLLDPLLDCAGGFVQVIARLLSSPKGLYVVAF